MSHKAPPPKPPRSPKAKARSRLRFNLIGLVAFSFLVPLWSRNLIEVPQGPFLFLGGTLCLIFFLFRLTRDAIHRGVRHG